MRHLYHVALRFDEFFHRFYNKNECPIHFTIFSNPTQWNWSWIFYYFLKNFWAFLWLESKTMVFVRSSKVTNGWLVTIRDPESVIVTLQGYALQGNNGFLGVTHGYQFHWLLSRTLQMVHLVCNIKKVSLFFLYQAKIKVIIGGLIRDFRIRRLREQLLILPTAVPRCKIQDLIGAGKLPQNRGNDAKDKY